MTQQTITGWPWMQRNVKRYFRAAANPGLIDDESIADAFTEGERKVAQEAYESGVGWLVKSSLIADPDQDLGSAYAYDSRVLFVNEDMGISDLVRVKALMRENAAGRQSMIRYLGADNKGLSEDHPTYGNFGQESWMETGGLNASGVHEMAIRIFNYGKALPSSSLRVDYWFSPPTVLSDWFNEADSQGDLTKSPVVPSQTWPFILNYAKLVLSEQSGDSDRTIMLRSRVQGRTGLLQDLRAFLRSIQTEDSEGVTDVYQGEW